MAWGRWLLFISFLVILAGAACTQQDSESYYSTTTQSDGTSINDSNATVGSIEELDLTGNSSSISFSETSGDDYLLILNAPATSSDTLSFQISSLSPLGSALLQTHSSPQEKDLRPEDRFHLSLRELEKDLIESGAKHAGPSDRAALKSSSSAPQIGDIETFQVIHSMTSLNQFDSVSAKLRVVTEDTYYYVDSRVEADVATEDLEYLANDFSNSLAVLRPIFGQESDINSDGHMTILLNCNVNTFATSGGFVTGFFNPTDMFQTDGSNDREIFYTVVPDPTGSCGGITLTAEFTLRYLLPGVVPHEWQHLLSFYQHVFVNQTSPETAWLNEGISHLVEDITGHNGENQARVKLFLNDPANTSLTPSYSPTLAERGASYLFLRYLYEQAMSGTGFMRNLVHNTRLGTENVESAFQGTNADLNNFEAFERQWSIALALSETGLSSDSKYNYQTPATNPETGIHEGVCIRCDTQDGRGTVLGGPVITAVSSFPVSGSIKPSATQFYQLISPSGTVHVSDTGGGLQGTLIHLQGN